MFRPQQSQLAWCFVAMCIIVFVAWGFITVFITWNFTAFAAVAAATAATASGV